MNLITTQSPTMTSDELLDLVNEARAGFGEPAVRRNDFVARCKDELEGDYYETFVVQNMNNTQSEAIRLTRDQCKLVAMRESKGVRRRVVARLNELEARHGLPDDYISALEHLLESKRSEQAAITERDHAVATKALIGSKREATAMATASAASREAQRLKDELGRGCLQATVTAVEIATGKKYPQNAYVALRTWCRDHGVKPAIVPDSRFGKVKAWPAGAWMDVYQIDLAALFGDAGEQA